MQICGIQGVEQQPRPQQPKKGRVWEDRFLPAQLWQTWRGYTVAEYLRTVTDAKLRKSLTMYRLSEHSVATEKPPQADLAPKRDYVTESERVPVGYRRPLDTRPKPDGTRGVGSRRAWVGYPAAVTYETFRSVYSSIAKAPLGGSDHNTVLLRPTYKQILKRMKPVEKQTQKPAGKEIQRKVNKEIYRAAWAGIKILANAPFKGGKKLDPSPDERVCLSSANKLNEFLTHVETGGGDNIPAWQETDNAGMGNTHNTLIIEEEVVQQVFESTNKKEPRA
ncbi:hypothetical protein N1851_002168 [Merluccius polli]|uniref:Uncharacterized protein n=1 Tax=Merluccius polli TaxID=89951 RepID=A0AA47NBF9_MERPO|nr:hypothetical protein N1851_002168 [Merluccius polli]